MYIRLLYFKPQVTSVYFEEGWLDTNVYMLASLGAGHCIAGPAIIMDKLSTILIEPGLFMFFTLVFFCIELHVNYFYHIGLRCIIVTLSSMQSIYETAK